jgi:hypothetical protein
MADLVFHANHCQDSPLTWPRRTANYLRKAVANSTRDAEAARRGTFFVEKHMTGPDHRETSLTRRAFVQRTVCAGAVGLVVAAEEKPLAPAFLAGSDWPMCRHGPALSATSPIRGGLAEAPRVAWSLDLGGPRVPSESVLVRDVTSDGRHEFLALSTDSVTCRDNRGRTDRPSHLAPGASASPILCGFCHLGADGG